MQIKATAVRPTDPEDDWRAQATCREIDPELFFGPDAEPPSAARRREEVAAKVCESCQVAGRCLSWALRNGADFGVWGGLSRRERLAIHDVRHEVRS